MNAMLDACSVYFIWYVQHTQRLKSKSKYLLKNVKIHVTIRYVGNEMNKWKKSQKQQY